MALSTPHYMKYDDFVSANIFVGERNRIQYCMDVGILRDKHHCERCNTDMIIVEVPETHFGDGICWKCPGSEHYASIRLNSILYQQSTSIERFQRILWQFCKQTSVSQTAGILGVCEKNVRKMFKSIRRCMAEDLLQTPVTIGGIGRIVEIDESKFGKRKYHRGRWVVG